MKLVATPPQGPRTETEAEIVDLSPAQLELLGQLSRALNPEMPIAFGAPHVVRTLLEKLEEAEERRSKPQR
jgi:hypothetical protein